MPRSSNILLLTLRVLSIGMLIFLIVQLGLIANNEVFSFWEVLNIFGQLRDLLSYLMYIILYFIYYGLVLSLGSLLSMIPGMDSYFIFYFSVAVFYSYIGRWFFMPGVESITPTENEVFSALSVLGDEMLGDFYLLILRAMVGALFYFAIKASLTSNPGESIKTIALLNGVLMIPMFFVQLDVVFNLIAGGSPIWIQENILANSILKDSIFEELTSDLGAFLSSDIFRVAVSSFLYLEISFQVAYIDKIIKPTQEREGRLSAQIDRMHENAEEAIANIKRIKEEQRKKKLLARNLESMQHEMEEKKRLSLRSFMSDKSSGATGFSFIEELISKKESEAESEKKLRAMRDTQRVSRYLDKLFDQDPEAKDTLTAQSAAPKASNLIKSTIINIIFRFFAITVLTYICIHPYYTFTTIFNAPESIARSVELHSIEGVLSIFIPVLLVIPLSSTIIKVTKQSKMREQLRLEEIKRLGITEEEYDEMIKNKDNIGEKEKIELKRDKDAMRAEQEKAQAAN